MFYVFVTGISRTKPCKITKMLSSAKESKFIDYKYVGMIPQEKIPVIYTYGSKQREQVMLRSNFWHKARIG